MQSSHQHWIWEHPKWPAFTWQEATILPLLQTALKTQGILQGKAEALSIDTDPKAALDVLLQNIVSSSAIEGETLNVSSVRSSLAKRFGIPIAKTSPTSSRSDGLAEMMLDAVNHLNRPLNLDQLCQWHQCLFPADIFSVLSIKVGQLRRNETMQVVSGRIDKPKVHFEAPPRDCLETEINQFIEWFNSSYHDKTIDPLLRAGICHLWLITLHPFDDGNGRITRALTDRALAQADSSSLRLYTMSATILQQRKAYYQVLEASQCANMDITLWLEWFLSTLIQSIQSSIDKIDRTINKARFWRHFNNAGLSAEQSKVLNRLLDGGENNFEHGISASQYQRVAKVSKATATRHLVDLLNKGCLQKLPGGGRSTRYQVCHPQRIKKKDIQP